MPLLDEAAHALQVLLASEDLRAGPISFVCHSLGGLIVKQVLRIANERSGDPAIAELLSRVRQVVFIATPHTGSGKANLLERLFFVAWPSLSARDLVANRPELRDLNFGYRELAARRAGRLAHLVYYEMSDTLFGRIVEADAADPGVPACVPTPINADHVSIAKPRGREELLYAQTRQFIAGLSPEAQFVGSQVIHPRLTFEVERPWWRLAPRVARLAVLALVAWGLYAVAPRFAGMFSDIGEIKKDSEETRRRIDDIARSLAAMQATSLPASLTTEQRKTAENNAAKQIEAAVMDLAQRNDPRAKEAVEALQRGSTREAEAFFNAAYEDNVRSGNNAAAAKALRNIAAFNRLTNVVKALDAYAEAVQLDPDNYANWIDLGNLALLAGRFSQADEAFGRAFALAKDHAEKDPAWRRELFNAQLLVGDSLLGQGKYAEARENYEGALQIVRALMQSAPDNIDLKTQLSYVLERTGHIFTAERNYSAALIRYQGALDLVRSRATVADPSSQRDLGMALLEVGHVHRYLGEPQLAMNAYSEAVDVLRGLAMNHAEDPRFWDALAQAYRAMGNMSAGQGKWAEADSYYQRALYFTSQLADRDTGNVVYLGHALAVQGDIGQLLLRQHRVRGLRHSGKRLLWANDRSPAGQIQALSSNYHRLITS